MTKATTLGKASVVCMALCVGGSAWAATLQDMLGRWRWQDFTIEVSKCQGDNACAKIVAGPKNVGMDVFASKLTAKDGDWVGQITHPETKEDLQHAVSAEGQGSVAPRWLHRRQDLPER